MKQRVADYIADFLVSHGVTDLFTVVGGGAMHLNNAFGRREGLTCTYCHHEQAAAMAAEAYARVDNRVAAVCVTTGPGATNAVTGAACAWMDSIPLLVFSGQVRTDSSVESTGLPLRTFGVQEIDIISAVTSMTKYCERVTDPLRIRYCLEKALFLARSGRPGPCWLDLPLNVQGAVVETDALEGFPLPAPEPSPLTDALIAEILSRIDAAARPLLFLGSGVRLSGAHERALRLIDTLNIPVVTGMSSVDAVPTAHPLFVGRSGNSGERAANFAVQSCDLLLSLGSRQGLFQTGYAFETWAPNAYKILNDIDPAELAKPGLHADCTVCCDAGELIDDLLDALPAPLLPKPAWIGRCRAWRDAYPVVLPRHYAGPEPNIYAFYQTMTDRLGPGGIIVTAAGTSRVAGSQASVIHPGTRFLTNPTTAAMGYCLPAAVGACIAAGRRRVVLVTGEGSLQMNLQELQTIVHNRLPVVLFVMSNGGYHTIRMSQTNFFGGELHGVGPESGDLSFPDLSALIPAYGLPFRRCSESADLSASIDWALTQAGPCVCELMLSTQQVTEPIVKSRRLPDGQMSAASLENMYPFLDEEELRRALAFGPGKEV